MVSGRVGEGLAVVVVGLAGLLRLPAFLALR